MFVNPSEPQKDLSPIDISRILALTLLLFMLFFLFSSWINEQLSLLLGELLLIVPALLYVRKRRLPVSSVFRIHGIRLKTVAAAVVLFVPVYILIDELDRLIQNLAPMPEDWFESMLETVSYSTWQEAALIFLGSVVVAAIAEEMLFRGLLQRSLESFRDPASAVVSASVLFSLVHFNPWTAIQILLLGVVLGYVAWQSNSILPSVIVHGLNNFISLLMVNAPEGSWNWYAGEVHVRPAWILLAAAFVWPALRFFRTSCRSEP